MVGVSRPVGESLSCVELWVSPNLTPYIITKPIHESQKIKSKDESGTIIQLNLYVNYELKQLLLSYGEGIKVLSPINLSEEIQRRLSESVLDEPDVGFDCKVTFNRFNHSELFYKGSVIRLISFESLRLD